MSNSTPTGSVDELRDALQTLVEGYAIRYQVGRYDDCRKTLEAIMQLILAREEAATTMHPFEVQNYKRLMALESRGTKEYKELREAPALSAERVVSFINQLSPWNLKTTGIDILNDYVQSLPNTTKEG